MEKAKDTSNPRKSFWHIRSVKTAFMVRGLELLLLAGIVSRTYFYRPDLNVVYIFLSGMPVAGFLSFLFYKAIKFRSRARRTRVSMDHQENNEKKESSVDVFTVVGLVTFVSIIVTILFNLLASIQTGDSLYARFSAYFTPKDIQIVVNAVNIGISFLAIILFLRLYRRISNSAVSIINKDYYQTLTDIPPNQLEQRAGDNLKRVKNLEKQYILFIVIFAISLVSVYLPIIVHSVITLNDPVSPYRSLNAFDFIINIINFSGAVFIFLAFKVLHNDTLHSDHTSWTGFWVLPICVTFMYLLGVGLTYLVILGVDQSTYPKQITEAVNITDLTAGLANGLAMTLLFGRYVSIEYSSRGTKAFAVSREILQKRFSYTNFISTTIIWFLPFYALAQPLFGSLTIDDFGRADVFQTAVFAICLVGKILFFAINYLIVKDQVMNLYLHGIVAKVGNPKELEKCLQLTGNEK